MSNQNTGKQAMISLISEQAMPNVMAPLLMDPRPSKMVCILPRDREKLSDFDKEFRRIYDGIDDAFAALRADTDREIELDVNNRGPVSPYDLSEVKRYCREAREDLVAQGYDVVYNVTGGTKLMAQAALEDARDGSCRAVYVDTEFRKLVQVEPSAVRSDFTEESLRPIDVPHYLAAYGLGQRRGKGDRSVSEPNKEAARLLAAEPRLSPSILRLIIGSIPRKEEKEILIPLQSLTSSERQHLERIVDVLSGEAAHISIGEDTLTLKANGSMYDFWAGRRWLEWYVFSVLEDLNKSPAVEPIYNQPWCDIELTWDPDNATEERVMTDLLFVEYESAGRSVRTPLPLNELDVVAVRGGRLLLCECKTGTNALQSEHFYKLHVLGKRLGTFADMAFITDVSGLDRPDCEDATIRRQAVRALTLNVLVVGLEELPGLGKILEEPDKHLRKQKGDFGLR